MTEPQYDDDTTFDDDDDDGSTDERYVQLSRQQIRAMERDAKQARKAQDEAASLRRELAFARAGGEFTERQQKALLATIDGDITAEAIREAAVDLGFVQAAAGSAASQEAAGLARMSDASNGSPDPGDEDPIAALRRADREGGKEALEAQIRKLGGIVA